MWQAQLTAVQEALTHRTPQQEEAILRWAGGVGTVTPAGLWNEIVHDLNNLSLRIHLVLGIAVNFLHGLTDSWLSFEPTLRHLPPSIHAFVLSQRGHGDSDRPRAGYAPSDFAGDVTQFIQALEIGPAFVVGDSMSSTVAQQFARSQPELTRGLALLGSVIDFAGNPAVGELADVTEQLEDPVDPAFIREFEEATLAQPISLPFLNPWSRRV